MKLQLSDGQIIPVVKPHLGDQLEVELSMKPRVTPQRFRELMQTAAFATAFTVFASLRRAGVETAFSDVLEMDLEKLSAIVRAEPGEQEILEGEGEETPDPPKEATPAKRGKR